MTMTYEGGCHCGLVRFRVSGELREVTECNCSICAKKGFLHWIVAPEQFELLSGDDALVTYQFHTGTARHRFCQRCGVHSFYVPRSDPDKIDINVRCLEGVDPARLAITPFDGQNWDSSMGGHVPWRKPGLVLVATLSVRREALEQFRAFERQAALIMRRHGGAIVRTVAVDGPADAPLLEEIHVVAFPDSAAFTAYRNDPDMVAAEPLRTAAIAGTKVVFGSEGPDYG